MDRMGLSAGEQSGVMKVLSAFKMGMMRAGLCAYRNDPVNREKQMMWGMGNRAGLMEQC